MNTDSIGSESSISDGRDGPSNRQQRRRHRPRVRPVFVWLAIIVASMVALSSTPSSAEVLDDRRVFLTVAGVDGASVIDLESLTFGDAVARLSTGTDEVMLPVFPLGATPTNIGVASIETRSDGAPSIAITGSANLFGLATDVLVTATWDDATDTGGTTAVVFDLRGADLTQLVATDLPVSLSNTLVGIALTPHTIDADALPSLATSILSDGSSLTSEMSLVDGISVRALVDATDPILAQTAADIGLEPVLRLEGSLSGRLEDAFAGEPTSPTAVSLRATTVIAGTPGQLPDYVAPVGEWSLSLDVASGSLAASAAGELAITVGSQVTPVAVSAGIEYNAPDVSLTLNAEVGAVENFFDQEWLDFDELTFDATVSSTNGVSASLGAVLNLEDLTGNVGDTAAVTFVFDAASAGVSGSLNIDVNSTQAVTVPRITTGLGANVDDLLQSAELSLSRFTLSLSFDGTDGFSGVAAISSEGAFTVGTVNIAGDLLLRAEIGTAAQPRFLVALDADIATNTVSLRGLVGDDLPFDVSIPSLRFSISSSDVSVPVDDLDAATAAFLGEGQDLDIPNGVVLATDIQLEQDLIDITDALGIQSDGLLRTEIRVPLLGYTSLETSVTVHFPEITGEGVFRSGAVSLEAKQAGASFSLKVVGEASVAVPRDQDSLCNGTAPTPPGYSCEDLLDFQLDAAISLSETSASLTLGGELRAADGWKDPTGLRGITMFGLRLEGGVELGESGPQVKFGFRSQLRIDGLSQNRQPITLTTAFAFGVTPAPPYIVPEGFTFASDGFGLADVTTLAEVLIQEPVPALDLPADFRLEQVFVSVSTATNPDLCLTQGFTVQAQLHLGGEKQGDGVPVCSPTLGQDLTNDCAERASCLAAASIDAQTSAQGTPGLNASARINGFDLGVIQSGGVDVQLQISANQQRLFIDGNATLQIPLAPPNDPIQIAEASVFVDFTPFQLIAEVEATLGDPQGAQFGVRMRGVGRLELTDPEFVFEVEFDTALLEEIGAAIEQGVNDMAVVVDQLLVVTTEDALVFNNLDTLLDQRGDSPVWLTELVTALADVEQAFEDVNTTFRDIGLPEPLVITELRNVVLNGVTITSGGIPAIDYGNGSPDGVQGCANLHGRSIDGNCYVVPPIEVVITGVCDDPGFKANAGPDVIAVLCGDFSGINVATQVFEQNIEPTLAAPLPAGLDAATLLTDIGPSLAGGQVAVECGGFTIDTVAGTMTDPAVALELGSRPLLVGLDVDPFAAVGTPVTGAGAGLSAVFDSLAGEAAPAGSPCTAGSRTAIDPNASIAFEAAPGDFDSVVTVVEGSTSTALVVCEAPTATVRFGDGSAPVQVDLGGGVDVADKPADSTELVQHTWLRDSADGFPFLPVVECGDGRSASGPQVTVVNGAIRLDELIVTPDPLPSNGRATVEVRFSDPGDDAHTVTLSSNSGPNQEIELAPRRGSERSEQRIATFEVPLRDGIGAFKPNVEVEDNDSTKDSAELVIDLLDVAPTFVSLTPFDVVDGQPVDPNAGPISPQEGQAIIWRLEIADPNLTDDVTVEVTFADGTIEVIDLEGSELATVVGTNGSTGSFPVGNAVTRSAFFERTETLSGSTPWQIRITDSSGLETVSTQNVVISGVAPIFTGLDIPRSAQSNAPFTIGVTAFDPAVDDDVTLTVEWGDGTQIVETSSGDGAGNHSFQVGHTYTVEPGVRLIRVTLTDSTGLSTVWLPLRQIQITPAAPNFIAWDIPTEVNEFEAFTFSYSFTADGGESYRVEYFIDETGRRGDISQIGLVNGQATVGFDAIILDDDPLTLDGVITPHDGVFTIRARVTGLQTGLVSEDTREIRVNNLDPVIEAAEVGQPAVVTPGVPLEFGVRYTDPGLRDEHSVTIDWGDGTTSGPTPFINLRADNRQVIGLPHTYAAGSGTPYTVTVTVTDDNGGTDTITVPVTVVDPAPSISEFTGPEGLVDEGDSGNVSLVFDATTVDDEFTATIDWGDGTSTTTAVEIGRTDISHAWTQDGTYDVAVTVTDSSGITDNATTRLTVANLAPSWTLLEVPDEAEEGAVVTVSAAFTDPGAADIHRIVIDWGDGSPATVAENTDDNVELTHVYAEAGTYTVTATVTDEAGADDTTTREINITNAAPTVSAALSNDAIAEGNGVALDIVITDLSPSDTHIVTIDWGEGWSISDVPAGLDATSMDARFSEVEVGPEGRTVTALNAYGDDGIFDITVTVVDDDGATALATLILTVDGVSPTGIVSTLGDVPFATVDAPAVFEATASDLGSDDLTFRWTVDGEVVAEQTSLAGDGPDGQPSPLVGGRINVVDTFTLAFDMPCRYEVGVSVIDDDGEVTDLGSQSVVTLGSSDGRPLSAAQWRQQFRTGQVDADRTACLGAVIDELSSIVGPDVLDDVDRQGIPNILENTPAPQDKLAREQKTFDTWLVVTLLNVAEGRLDLASDVDGVSLAQLLADVELVRSQSADWREVQAAHRRLRIAGR